MFQRRGWWVPVALIAMAGCGGAAEREAVETLGPSVVTVMAGEFAFDMPDTISAGMTTFRLMSHGQEVHHLQLLRLEEGKTLADLSAAFSGEVPPPWAVPVGGVAPPMPGATAEATLDLTPGTYAAVCFVPSPDGVPHVAKGMIKGFTVIASSIQRSAPTADIVLSMSDFTWDMMGPVTAGHHVFRVENHGTQPHETVLLQLSEGTTVGDFVAWVSNGQQGPPPAELLGGVLGFLPGGGPVYFEHDFTPGEYGLVCFLPDVGDGQPHVAHGMMMQFSVQ